MPGCLESRLGTPSKGLLIQVFRVHCGARVQDTPSWFLLVLLAWDGGHDLATVWDATQRQERMEVWSPVVVWVWRVLRETFPSVWMTWALVQWAVYCMLIAGMLCTGDTSSDFGSCNRHPADDLQRGCPSLDCHVAEQPVAVVRFWWMTHSQETIVLFQGLLRYWCPWMNERIMRQSIRRYSCTLQSLGG